LRDLVHALTDADGSREMEDAIDAGKRRPHRRGIAHIAAAEFDIVIEVGGTDEVRSVNLRKQIIERSDAIASAQQIVGQMRADKSRAAGDQHRVWHVFSGSK
jgi:hypothetical protein